MTPRNFEKNVIIPLVMMLLLYFLLKPICMENGVCDYRKLLLLSGIPFGVRRMFLWIAPRNLDIGGAIGVLVFNLLVGGIIGSVELIFRVVVAAGYILITFGHIIWGLIKNIFQQAGTQGETYDWKTD